MTTISTAVAAAAWVRDQTRRATPAQPPADPGPVAPVATPETGDVIRFAALCACGAIAQYTGTRSTGPAGSGTTYHLSCGNPLCKEAA